MPSIPGYVYAHQGDSIYVNLFMTNMAQIEIDNGRKVNLVQQTRYPWDGNIKITVNPEQPGKFTMKVRIPGWARDQVVPSDLYRFTHPMPSDVQLKVNGGTENIQLENGYATITRAWRKGDSIDLDLPMPVRRVLAFPRSLTIPR
jgi:hypothetical protein